MKSPTQSSATPAEVLASLDEPRRTELTEIDAFIRKAVPKLKPVVIGKMLGYGPFHYRYATGREGVTCKVSLASNKNYISIYVCAVNDKGYLAEQYAKDLGKASCGKSCIRFKKFDDLDHAVLKKVLKEAEACGYGV